MINLLKFLENHILKKLDNMLLLLRSNCKGGSEKVHHSTTNNDIIEDSFYILEGIDQNLGSIFELILCMKH